MTMPRKCRRGGCREINEEKRAAQAERDALKQERDRLAFEQQEFRRRMAQLEKPANRRKSPSPIRCLIPAATASSWRSVSRNVLSMNAGR